MLTILHKLCSYYYLILFYNIFCDQHMTTECSNTKYPQHPMLHTLTSHAAHTHTPCCTHSPPCCTHSHPMLHTWSSWCGSFGHQVHGHAKHRRQGLDIYSASLNSLLTQLLWKWVPQCRLVIVGKRGLFGTDFKNLTNFFFKVPSSPSKLRSCSGIDLKSLGPHTANDSSFNVFVQLLWY